MDVSVPSFRQLERQKHEDEFIAFFNAGFGPSLVDMPSEILAIIDLFLSYNQMKSLRLLCKEFNSKILPFVQRSVTVTVRHDPEAKDDVYQVVRCDKRRLHKQRWELEDFDHEESILNVAKVTIHSSINVRRLIYSSMCRTVTEYRSFTTEIFDCNDLPTLKTLELPVKSLKELLLLPFNKFSSLERLIITYCGPPRAESNDLIFELLKANLFLPHFQFRYGGFDILSSLGGAKEAMNHEQILKIVDLYYLAGKRGTVRLPRITVKECDKVAQNLKNHSDVWHLDPTKLIFDVRLGRRKYLTLNLEEMYRNQLFVTFRIRIGK